MKRYFCTVFILFFYFFFASFAFAASKIEWHKVVLGNQKEGIQTVYDIFLYNMSSSCVIAFNADDVIEIRARDYNWNGKEVLHYVKIDTKNRYISNEIRTQKVSTKYGYVNMYFGHDGYRVFDRKFVNLAKKLPPDARKKFKGAYGIK